ncbi:receptor-like protein 7 [Rhodamnia argentea]|uniref:Receptor-like protein 7 n=1 Tax=Rhodamnia argentea TaxID=178133 RepID=A0ABM3H4Z4_9MYRT|nr:receptor-like protein 7 [Rhodamnia argentea]
MEFKRSFRTNTTDSRCEYPKVHSWSPDGSGDCCSWDGVECDEVTGRVITLDLSGSCLSGTMSPNTTLFRLFHLESLNLACNSFNFSPIPYGFGNLSRLQYLNLSRSDFAGEIPHDISQLSELVSLDLSDSFSEALHLPNVGNFVHNLTGLKELDLSRVSLLSPIPPVLANFSSLTSLGLADCGLNGDFPVSIFQLPNLEVLRIASNGNLPGFLPKLHWGSPLKSLDLSLTNFSGGIPTSIGNLSLLNELIAWNCHFSGSLPSSLGNLSHLTEISLGENNLQGQIPVSFANLTQLRWLWLSSNSLSGDTLEWVVNLTKLTELDLSDNNLQGQIPVSFANLTQLRWLWLSSNSLSGDTLEWVVNLTKLTELDLSDNNLRGQIPVSFANLTQLRWLWLSSNSLSGDTLEWVVNLTKLTELDLSDNNLQGQIPVSFANLTRLRSLWLSSNNLSGDTLEWVVNLTKLTYLDISGNRFSGEFPSSFENLKQLVVLDLSRNDLHGDIPSTLWNLKGLQSLSLESLYLNGVLDVNDLFKLKNLRSLQLSFNNISFTKSFITATTSKLSDLSLDSCNLTEFPQFIGYLSKLERLNLPHNRIRGTILSWMWNNSKESLNYIDLSHNLLTGFVNNQTDVPLPNLAYLDVSSNLLETTLPIPPPSVMIYNISSNFLSGEVPTSICQVSSLVVLDLSNNALNGTLPPCLGSIAPLIYLNLARNKFSGMIPRVYPDGCALKMIDLRENRLGGTIPRSLGNCGALEYLNLGSNEINDTFPIWMSELAYLKVIGLQSNKFHGPVEAHLSQLNFTSLQILDLSNNSFNGRLPSKLLQSCRAMKVIVGQDKLAYMNIHQSVNLSMYRLDESMTYAMILVNKGTEREYLKIPGNLVAIDLSKNKFEGFIPELIGDLKALRMLNLSNNFLTGRIPPSPGKPTMLESLDLSLNNLMGEIPQQLASLTFLEVFDVSQNRLSGPIPHGTQFDTFESSSFTMNAGLCGSPLPNKCKNGDNAPPPPPPPPPSFDADNEEESLFDLDWKIVLTGVGVGFGVGVVLENLIIDEKSRWFLHYSKRMAKGCRKGRKALADKKICS